jgi:subtilase family serine protease
MLVGAADLGGEPMRRHKLAAFAVISAPLLCGIGTTASADTLIGHQVSPLVAHATDKGALAGSSPIQITVWLKLRDEAGLENIVTAPTADGKALSAEQVRTQYAPAAHAVAAVSGFLRSKGLTVTGVGPQNLYVTATGSTAVIESAFKVQLHNYEWKGQAFHANRVSPSLPDAIAPFVASVGGLTNLKARPMLARRLMKPTLVHPADAEAQTHKPMLAGAHPNGLIFSPQCFYAPTSVSFSATGVTANYQGTRYGADINNSAPGTVPPCGYQPSDLQSAYNLHPLYRAGLDGRGQTIAIVDAFGSTTIARDAQAFSQAMGLPPVNLTVIGTPTESNFSTDENAGWATETTLDVEWVHAIAPGAKIVLVVTPDNSFDNLFAGIVKALQQSGVVAVSNSWGGLELGTDPEFRASADNVFKVAGAQGVSVNFSSGDSGDEAISIGMQDADWPASSPYVTAIGGVSVALDRHQQILFQTSWGNNLTQIAGTIDAGSPPLDPPSNEGFIFGGGGGTSDVYPQPKFQHGLGGQRRLLPDISWVADPYTGVEIIFTADEAGDLGIDVIGGTSLSCPMFSGLWGIVNQKVGHRLGQAARYLYDLPNWAIEDVRALSSSNNVTGVIHDAGGTANFSSWELADPLQGQQKFLSTLYNSPFSTNWFVLTFGMDSSLQAGPGYDLATGLGTPNGARFVAAF